jgi:hypothetical protein
MVGIALTVVACGAAAAVAYDRWSCPSDSELQRPRAPIEVATAFKDRGITPVPDRAVRVSVSGGCGVH